MTRIFDRMNYSSNFWGGSSKKTIKKHAVTGITFPHTKNNSSALNFPVVELPEIKKKQRYCPLRNNSNGGGIGNRLVSGETPKLGSKNC